MTQYPRFPVMSDMFNVFQGYPGLVETELDRSVRKSAMMLDAGKSLFFDSGDDLTIFDKRSGRIAKVVNPKMYIKLTLTRACGASSVAAPSTRSSASCSGPFQQFLKALLQRNFRLIAEQPFRSSKCPRCNAEYRPRDIGRGCEVRSSFRDPGPAVVRSA